MSRPHIARRRLAAAVFSVFCLGVLSAESAADQAPVRVKPSLAASPAWLTRFNAWRANTGTAMLSEDTTWSAGDYAHALYMVKNDLVTHYETPGVPYYTVAGDTAARNSNIFVSSSTATTDDQAIDWWMGAPFHAMGMMDPRLTTTGFGSYREVKSGWDTGAAVDVLRGNSFSGGSFPVFFPGNGSIEPLTSYSGNEYPDPLQACPGYSMPTGLPVFVELGGNVSTSVGAHSFSGNGTPLAHCVIDSSNPSVGSSLLYRGGVVVIPRQPLQNGVRYSVSLTVNGVAYGWSFTVGSFSSCTGMTASIAPPSPVKAGTVVTVNGSASGCPNPIYEFWLLPPGGLWTAVQPYSGSSTFTWNTAGKVPGSYLFSVWTRDASSGNSYDAFSAIPYSVTSASCTSVGVSTLPNQAATAGNNVTVTATAAGCTQPQYQFWLLPPGGTWTLAQAYSATTTFTWATTGRAPGVYLFSVWVRDASSGGTGGTPPNTYDSFSAFNYTLVVAPCSGMSASAVPASTATSGTTVKVTGSAAGCGTPQYEFWLKLPNGTWTGAQGWSSSNTFTWSTAGMPAGTYLFSVWARDASSSGRSGTPPYTYDSYSAFPYTLMGARCTSVSASSVPATAASRGNYVTVTGAASGCPAPQYEFWLKLPNGTWTLAQGWSSSNSFVWPTSAALPAGSYLFSVWVRDASSSGSPGTPPYTYDAYSAFYYTLT